MSEALDNKTEALDELGHHRRGWWNMPCWNGLSPDQQIRLIQHGNLPFGYKAEGSCRNGADVGIETAHDAAPGPRFYCRPCGIAYLSAYGGAT